MIGRKNKGPSLAIATATGGTGAAAVGTALGGFLGYLAGSFEPLGGAIPAASAGILDSILTSVGSVSGLLVGSVGPSATTSLLTAATSLGTSLTSWSAGWVLDMSSSLGITSFPLTSISNLVGSVSVFPSALSSIIPSF